MQQTVLQQSTPSANPARSVARLLRLIGECDKGKKPTTSLSRQEAIVVALALGKPHVLPRNLQGNPEDGLVKELCEIHRKALVFFRSIQENGYWD